MLNAGNLWKQDTYSPYPCEAQSLLGREVSKYDSIIKIKLYKKSKASVRASTKCLLPCVFYLYVLPTIYGSCLVGPILDSTY